jgi:hypothetical protein
MKELRNIFLKGLFFIFLAILPIILEIYQAIYRCPETVDFLKTKNFIFCLFFTSISLFYFLKYLELEKKLDRNSSR